MGIGVSIFLIAVGAILAFAVNTAVSGLELATVGWILMGVGVLGLLFTLLFLDSFTARRTGRVGTVVHEEREIL